MDTYAGRMMEPATLHKYLYTHADPVNGIDPSGNTTMSQVSVSLNVQSTLQNMKRTTVIRTFTKMTSEIVLESVLGVPIPISPKSLASALRKLPNQRLLQKGVRERLQNGREFEKWVKESLGLKKNKECFKDTVAISPNRGGCFIPDFFVGKRGSLVEVKLSAGALKKKQFQEFIKIGASQGKPVTMMFHRRPSGKDVDRMTKWAHEVLGDSNMVRLNITHIL